MLAVKRCLLSHNCAFAGYLLICGVHDFTAADMKEHTNVRDASPDFDEVG